MRDFPSCFGESGVQIADPSFSSSVKSAHNMVHCVYQCESGGHIYWVTTTWSRNMMGLCLQVAVDDAKGNSLCKLEIKPWMFSKRKGSKSLLAYAHKIDLFWDFCSAKFGTGPEPLSGFYVALSIGQKLALLLGNMEREAFRKTGVPPMADNAVLVSRREHVFGKRVFGAKVRFSETGPIHDVMVEFDLDDTKDPGLSIQLDRKTVIHVKHLWWKFRGNHTILLDGMSIDILWDVHNWVFESPVRNAIFVFGASPTRDKAWAGRSCRYPKVPHWSVSGRLDDPKIRNLGFTLILCAWKSE